jgi:hypothetical protein
MDIEYGEGRRREGRGGFNYYRASHNTLGMYGRHYPSSQKWAIGARLIVHRKSYKNPIVG